MIWLFKTIPFVQYHEKSISEIYIASPLCVSGRAWPARGDLQSGTPACLVCSTPLIFNVIGTNAWISLQLENKAMWSK